MKLARVIFSGITLMTLMWRPVHGQFFDESTTVKYETNFIEVYKDELTTRLYLSRKQNAYSLAEHLYKPWIQYKINDNLLLGWDQ